ncbi:MAG: hypothetical protein M3N98_16085, partial [Actinomycetota bacterium]|nr:hypothetical protein [Actinomycetota bacterium]
HPDKGKSALTGYGTAWRPNFLVAGSAARRYLGFNEADAPTEVEINERVAIAERLNVKETLAGQAPPGDELEPTPEETASGPPTVGE